MFPEAVKNNSELLGNTPQAYSHRALISAAFNGEIIEWRNLHVTCDGCVCTVQNGVFDTLIEKAHGQAEWHCSIGCLHN